MHRVGGVRGAPLGPVRRRRPRTPVGDPGDRRIRVRAPDVRRYGALMLTLVGMNHRSAPLELRERACFAEDDVPRRLTRLRESTRAVEGLIIATCNRVEILTRANDGASVASEIRAFLARERGLDDRRSTATSTCTRDCTRSATSSPWPAGSIRWCFGEPQILGTAEARVRDRARERVDRAGARPAAPAGLIRGATGSHRDRDLAARRLGRLRRDQSRADHLRRPGGALGASFGRRQDDGARRETSRVAGRHRPDRHQPHLRARRDARRVARRNGRSRGTSSRSS